MNEIIKKNGISYGIILGVISILLTTLIYAFNMELFGSWWLGLLILAINIVIYCVLLSKTKKQLNNDFSFKQAFTTYFIALAISALLSTVYNMVLFNVIDPGAKETIMEVTVKSSVEMMEKFGAPEAEIEKAVEGIRATDNYSIGNLIKGFFMVLAIGSVFGLIFAAIFKSRPAYKE